MCILILTSISSTFSFYSVYFFIFQSSPILFIDNHNFLVDSSQSLPIAKTVSSTNAATVFDVQFQIQQRFKHAALRYICIFFFQLQIDLLNNFWNICQKYMIRLPAGYVFAKTPLICISFLRAILFQKPALHRGRLQNKLKFLSAFFQNIWCRYLNVFVWIWTYE